jgi:hypothetical protein
LSVQRQVEQEWDEQDEQLLEAALMRPPPPPMPNVEGFFSTSAEPHSEHDTP